jgi:hypothetical protein
VAAKSMNRGEIEGKRTGKKNVYEKGKIRKETKKQWGKQ